MANFLGFIKKRYARANHRKQVDRSLNSAAKKYKRV